MDWVAGLPDWRDAHAYEPLLQAERPTFAWEWLRRRPDYRAAAAGECSDRSQSPAGPISEQPGAARWGLHAFENPLLPAGQARPIWRSDRHAFVIDAWAEPCASDANSFDLDAVRRLSALALAPGVEHLLLSDGYRGIRLDVRGAGLRGGPVRLHYQLTGMEDAKHALPILHRFIAFAATGTFSRSLHPPDRRARRQILLLRAHDALADGADQRSIAAELLSGRAAEARWRVSAPSLRSQVQRLVRGARRMGEEGFWELLR